MESHSIAELRSKKCVPCEGGVPRYTAEQAEAQVARMDGWQLIDQGRRIRRQWVMAFPAAIRFFDAVAAVAKEEAHHPDLHLERYRNVTIELWTHAIGGLSENDFILAAKIDQLALHQ